MALFSGKFGSFLKNRILLPIYDSTVGAVIGAFRGAFNSLTQNVHNIVDSTINTVTSIPENIKGMLENLDERIKSLPIGPGFTAEDFAKTFTEPSFGAANNAILAITGVNLQATFELISSPTAVAERIKQYTDVIAQQAITELKECIERCLQKLLGKVPELGWLLDWQNKLAGFIGEIRLKIERQIQSQIDKIIFDKLKLQQVALLKQKVLEGIRKMCPCDGEVAPSQVARLQNDITWSILNRDRDLLEIARETSPELAYFAENPNSTGKQSERIINEIIAEIEAEAYRQLVGFSDDTINTFVDDDGTVISDDLDVDIILPGTPTNTPIVFISGPIADPDIDNDYITPVIPIYDKWIEDGMPLGDRMWAGGTPWFDEQTGNKRTPTEVYNMLYPV